MNGVVYKGKKFNVHKFLTTLPDGRKAIGEVVDYPGAAAILPLLPNNMVLLLKQYRVPIGKWIIEIPAGTLKPGEKPLECAQRELEEETGFKAKTWIKMLEIYTSPGYSNEVLHIFLAKELEEGVKKTENTEVIENTYFTLDKAIALIKRGIIKDAKTIIAIFYYVYCFKHKAG